jgi:uncharacterized protein YqhQ
MAHQQDEATTRSPSVPEDRIIAYGGQAVIEGVMMRGQRAFSIAMRAPDGTIAVHTESLAGIYRSRLTRIPFVRGVILLWDALGLGMRALTISANTQTGEQEKLEGPALYLTLGLSMFLAIGLFFVLPAVLGGWVEHLLSGGLGAVSGAPALPVLTSGLAGARATNGVWTGNLAEGLARLALLVGYIWGIGFIPDVRRLFAYHGAEHKTINAFEAGAELTTDSVATFPLEHARCGTAFLLTLVLFSIIAFTVLGPLPLFWRLVSRVLLIPILAGVAVEYIRWTARHLRNPIVRLLIRPNLALQRLTTRTPDAAMLEVAIESFRSMRAAESAASP